MGINFIHYLCELSELIIIDGITGLQILFMKF